MAGQGNLFGVEHRLEDLSREGDPLEHLSSVVDFKIFAPLLRRAIRRYDLGRGGRRGHDELVKFKMLVLQSLYNLSLHQTSWQVKDRLSWQRFCGLGLGDVVPDENTLWDFREAVIQKKVLDKLFHRLDEAINAAGYLPMGGQIIDATLVPAPRQRMNRDEKQAVKDGVIPEDWQDNPKKLSQKDRDARWTVQVMKGRRREDGQIQPDLVIPFFGYKNHISVDRRHLIIRSSIGTDAASADGPRLREGLVVRNTSSQVWADTAYRSTANEEYLEKHGRVSLIHRKKPKGRPMPTRTRKANAKKVIDPGTN